MWCDLGIYRAWRRLQYDPKSDSDVGAHLSELEQPLTEKFHFDVEQLQAPLETPANLTACHEVSLRFC
jgi:hypothetical protein